MRVLVVSNGKLSDNKYRSILNDVLEVESIVFKYDISDAYAFVGKELIDGNKHIDLIICNYDYGYLNQTGRDLLIWIRNSSEMYYSGNALKLSSVPVVIVHATNEWGYLSNVGFDGALSYQDIEENRNPRSIMLGAIGRWIDNIMDDYNYLGIDPDIKQGYYSFAATLMVNVSAIHNCKVLSPVYSKRPYRLSILSFQREIDEIEKEIFYFQKEVVRISKLATRNQESEYHKALKKYRFILLGDSFDYYWHETPFMYPDGRESIRPDFIRRPYFYSDSGMLDIFEVKLPKEKILKSTEFHTPLSAKLFHSLAQVKDYQKYFNRSDTMNEVGKKLSTSPISLSYTLLIGRDEDRNHFYDILNTRLLDFGSSDIIVITYDSLINSREKMIEYRKLYRIR